MKKPASPAAAKVTVKTRPARKTVSAKTHPIQPQAHMQVQVQPAITIPAHLTATPRRPRRKIGWEWLLCIAVLVMVGSSIFGYDFLGLSGPFTAVVALGAGLVASIITIITAFILSVLVFPLLALLAAIVTALIGAATLLLGLLVSAIIMPLAALFSGLVVTLTTWLAGTWLGAMLMPVYNILAPIVLKISPWITTSQYAAKVWKKADQLPLVHQTFYKNAEIETNEPPASTHSFWHPANAKFSWLFMSLTAICLILFGAAEALPHLRQKLAAAAAVIEGMVFLMLAVVLYRARWGGNVPAWLPALLPVLGALFAWRLAYRRMAGLEV